MAKPLLNRTSPGKEGETGDMADISTALGWLLAGLAVLGCVYTLAAVVLVGRYRAGEVPAFEVRPVSVLKPLHGTEPRLYDNLQTLVAQDYGGPVEIVFGVARADDPALAMVERLRLTHPAADIRIVVDATLHGANAKMSNVINIAARARHPVIVLADSDVAWPVDTLTRLGAALAEPGVGLASCLHVGRGDAGFWSLLGAMDISYRFLPSIVVGIATGLATPTLGPTLALRRQTLDAVGGFAAFADVLADDYELGRAVRGLGLATVVPRFTITHSGDEADARALIRHELRWTRTIYGIDRWGFVGSMVTHCSVLALLATLLIGIDLLPLLLAAITCRVLLAERVDAVTGSETGPLWLLPLRDCLAAALFVATFFVDNVIWRGTRYSVAPDGRIS
jgi:ceramide glucosyltransferase